MLKRIIAAFLFLVLAGVVQPSAWEAQGKPLRIIRDAEIEAMIGMYADPLFRQAGLNPDAVSVYIIEDDTLNAFVANGLNIFLHTGFLRRTDGPGQLIGVLAHETGHIEGGHIAGRRAEAKRAGTQSLIAYALGLGAAIASGRPEILAATAIGSQDLLLKDLLRYTRGQEASADQAAVRLMEKVGYSPEGLKSFFDVVRGQEVLLAANQDPYLRSHPLTLDRIQFVEQAVAESPTAGNPWPEKFVEAHTRMKAKLIGFLEPQSKVLREYPPENVSIEARYARAITYYLQPDLMRAVGLIDGLIADEPENPYFHELKGQMLFENGETEDSIPPYREAVDLAPDSALLRLALGRALLATNKPADDKEALGHLQLVVQQEEGNAFAWHQLAIAQGRLGDTGKASLSLAESAWAKGNYLDARDQALRAQRLLEENSPGWLRAQDLEQLAARELRKRNE